MTFFLFHRVSTAYEIETALGVNNVDVVVSFSCDKDIGSTMIKETVLYKQVNHIYMNLSCTEFSLIS